MPYETFVVETASDILEGDRKHEEVAEKISATFEKIRKEGGEFVTAIAMADKTAHTGSGGHPNGALYIVADMPESTD